VIFPNILRVGNVAQIRTPIDDTHTQIYFVRYVPNEVVEPGSDIPMVRQVDSFKTPADQIHPYTHFRMDLTLGQDHMAWETQGPIADREVERLATTDRGILMWREIVKREIDKVEAGQDPLGTVRDPNHGIINTHLGEALAEMQERAYEGLIELLPEATVGGTWSTTRRD
jgi:5,5'-dehydrodivanillate O-demethylase oxygenase subunit